MKRGRKQVPFAWVAAGWVAAAAVLAGAGLVGLRMWHGRAARQAAALSVAERGQWMAVGLAMRAGSAAGGGDNGGWREFAGVVEALRGLEPELAFVSVRQGGVTLFQEVGGEEGTEEEGAGRLAGPVRVGRRLLAGEDGEGVPVVTFTASYSSAL